ncbi:helix-turn-helix transcriptional regulator [Kitasatospora sp. NPDC056731]|uniref:helix-turn-helix transcriptional regulator n=1 Tax=Kitasatospora sp. NPDC056731 TaxID=3155422 RepID=UPI003426B08D
MNGTGMSVLGLGSTEERLYRHFLRNPDTSDEDVHLLLHSSPAAVREARDHLVDLGLLRPSGAGALAATDPELAVERLSRIRLQALHEELQQVTQSRRLIDELRCERGARHRPAQDVERLEVLDEIRTRIDDLAFFAREEILSAEPYTELTPENIAHARPLDACCLRRGVRIRSVILGRALEHPPTAGYLHELAAQGAEIRVIDELAERILLYDRQTVLVPADPADTSRGALLTRQPGLVANALALFEKIWDEAAELPDPTGAEDTAEYRLSAMEQLVLAEMCRVAKDETGARNLGISVRTYRRHIAEILRVLGAGGRTQAALLARERGWI